MVSLEPLRAKLEERIREALQLPLERVQLVVNMERTFNERRGFFVLYTRRDTDWRMLRFEIPWETVEEAMPFPDEPEPDFVEAHRRWSERDKPRAAIRQWIADSTAYKVTP